MRLHVILAAFAATPVWAHESAMTHAHSEWALPVGMCLIAFAATAGWAKAKVRVQR